METLPLDWALMLSDYNRNATCLDSGKLNSAVMLQAHADALGNWASEDGDSRGGRRGWEQDGRIDLRSVANSLRQLPYHVAWQRGFRQAAQVLNPTIAIDVALENVRELDQGALTVRSSAHPSTRGEKEIVCSIAGCLDDMGLNTNRHRDQCIKLLLALPDM